MRTETVTYQIFSLGELSPEARARAYRKWLNDEPEYGWNAENKQTLNAFCDLLGIRCNKWEYDGYSYSFSWYSPYEDTIEKSAWSTARRLSTQQFRIASVRPENLLQREKTPPKPPILYDGMSADRVLYGQYDPRSDILLLHASGRYDFLRSDRMLSGHLFPGMPRRCPVLPQRGVFRRTG